MAIETRDEIVVTGVGTFSACGENLDGLDRCLESGVPPLTKVDRSAGFHRRQGSCAALQCGTQPAAPWIPLMKARRMSLPSRYAVVAAKQALADAGLEIPAERNAALAVAISTAFGPSAFTQRLLDQAFDEGPAAISPMLFTECVANAAPAQVAIHCRAGGPNYAISVREAGPIAAIGRAMTSLRCGRAEQAIAGNVEELTPLLHALLDRFRALAGSRGVTPERARPFGADRDGFLAAAGATLWVLERESAAKRRNARPHARIRGVAAAFDPTATPVGWGHGVDSLSRSLRSFLDRIDVGPDRIDAVVSGASGSVGGDRLEAGVLRQAWGSCPLPPIFAPKSITGEYGGPFLAAALRILNGATIGTQANGEEFRPDPVLGIVPESGGKIGCLGRVLVTGLGSGGSAGWMVLERA